MMQTCSAIAGLALNDELDAKLLVETGAVEVPKVDRFVPLARDVDLRIVRYRKLDAKLLVETGAVEVPKVDRFVPRPREVHLRIARYRRTWPC